MSGAATDPAPLVMVETVINLKPESEWRLGVAVDSLIAEMDAALQFPGVSNALDHAHQMHASTCCRPAPAPVGVKIFGKNLAEIERLARDRFSWTCR
jgi:Cu(I)/Ag(I) efflux system membrane protein CusA/SilA